MRKTFIKVQAWDDWYFRILGIGFSIQPLDNQHYHFFSTRHTKIQPLHALKHCWRFLK